MTSPRGTALTAAGKQLLEDVRFILSASKALRQRLFQVDAPTVTVTVAVMPGLLATAAVRSFEAEDPSRRAVIVQVGWRDQVEVIRRGDADVVYAREPIDHSGLGTAPLLEEPRHAVLPRRRRAGGEAVAAPGRFGVAAAAPGSGNAAGVVCGGQPQAAPRGCAEDR